jgi:diguanylate cyclase (GGDEF)-like protein/PAS domain S-box-containing protein
MVVGIRESIAIAKAWARRLSLVYIGVLALWVMVQGGIPMAPYLDVVIEETVWLQAIAGLVFAGALGWLLYLLIEKGLGLISQAQGALLLLERAVESTVNAVLISEYREPRNPIVYANRAFQSITGYRQGEAVGRNVLFLQGEDRDQPELAALIQAVRDERPHRAVLRSYRKDGSMYWAEVHVGPVKGEDGNASHFVTVLNDISEARRYQEELAYKANYDSLTNLANRNLLSDRIGHAIARCERYKSSIALCVVGLDKFRAVNDSFGYAAGNEVLRAVAARLRSRFRAVDTIARPGGDEFALLLVDQPGDPSLASQIQRVQEVFSQPFPAGERDVHLSAAIGVAIVPRDGDDGATLLKRAELAMHRAKEQGPNAFQMFSAQMESRAAERVSLETDLRQALERGELLLHYQPRVDLKTGRVRGAEALIRWQPPARGMVPPSTFIPLAEETGLILPIGEWALRTACLQNRAWQKMGLGSFTVAVNISATQFRQKGLAGRIAALLGETGLDPRGLELELTESLVMHDAEQVIAILRELKAMGVMLAIDDFGTGYSSLSYLKRFPVDHLKVDQSFVRGVPGDADDAAIVNAVISLGRSLGLRVVAEGVETEAQRAFLEASGCEEIQGYLVGRPMPAGELEAILRSQQASVPGPGADRDLSVSSRP